MKGGESMKLAKALVMVMALLVLSISGAIAEEQAAAPEKVLSGQQVITVHYGTGIKPETLTVNRGTTVIWVNQAMRPVAIKFAGKEITTACENPVNFTKDVMGGFIAKKVKFGAVASICFIEKGTYKYKVSAPTKMRAEVQKGVMETGKEFEGTIVVE
jgi:plastocyanin